MVRRGTLFEGIGWRNFVGRGEYWEGVDLYSGKGRVFESNGFRGWKGGVNWKRWAYITKAMLRPDIKA